MPRINYTAFIIGVHVLNTVILLIILDIVYVFYSFKIKKFTITWPLAVLRSVTSTFVTVLFLPITETLMSIIACETGTSGK
jgi:hypothetical protein